MKKLPPLIKKSATYKLIVPSKVEEKIRYLQRKYPSTEWSGVLFTTHTGTFEDNNLVITCHDIYPMDVGTSTFTDYNMDETVAGYIADNIDLFGCDLQLLHSHNNFACFFSGTDLNTLREEGNERNCFVSLIVNNTGPYCAAITRKVKREQKVITTDLGSSYEFFGEGIKQLDASETNTTAVIKDEVIEYYMLDVERETVDNPLEYLDTRFEEIEKKKAEANRKSNPLWNVNPIWHNKISEDTSFVDWIKDMYSEPKVKEQYLFDDKTMKEMETTPELAISGDAIHKCVVQMLTCSLLIKVEQFDEKSWIKHNMSAKYDELFAAPGTFDSWAEFIVDYLITNFFDETLQEEDYYDWDAVQSLVAQSMYEELAAYKGANRYIDEYLDVIDRYMV